MVLACSGGSNVGQMANEAALMLDRMGRGEMSCAAALAAKSPSVVQMAETAQVRVAIDGCKQQCVRKMLETSGYSVDVHVVVEEITVDKSHDFTPDQISVDRVVSRAVTQIKSFQANANV